MYLYMYDMLPHYIFHVFPRFCHPLSYLMVGSFPFTYLEVLQSLKSQSVSPVAPFPLSDQYVKNVSAAQAAAGGGGDETAEPAPKKPKKNDQNSTGHSEWMYGSIRKDYISKLVEGGMDYKSATSEWDGSHEKAVYLSVVSVQELKRRKFLKAGETENPWHQKIHGK